MPTATNRYWTLPKLPRVSRRITTPAASGRADRRRDVEQAERGGCARELGDDRADVGDEHRDGQESGPPHAEPLSDESGESLARRQTQPRAYFLREEEHDLAGQQHPQQLVAVLDPGDGVSGDAARVVVGEAADETRTEHAQDRGEPDPVRRFAG